MFYYLTESEMHNKVTGGNKAFMTRTIAKQKKYGNNGVFECTVDTDTREIKITLGESQGIFKQNYYTKKWEHDYGMLYNLEQCKSIVNEIATLYFKEVTQC